jgi:hypothetical protein
VNNSNPFIKADTSNKIMKKLDFSRLSNPELTLFPDSHRQSPKEEDENHNKENQPK